MHRQRDVHLDLFRYSLTASCNRHPVRCAAVRPGAESAGRPPGPLSVQAPLRPAGRAPDGEPRPASEPHRRPHMRGARGVPRQPAEVGPRGLQNRRRTVPVRRISLHVLDLTEKGRVLRVLRGVTGCYWVLQRLCGGGVDVPPGAPRVPRRDLRDHFAPSLPAPAGPHGGA
eukprot:751787-Prorocentrum_minimum.AAC.2